MKKVLISITTLFGGGAERVVSVWASELCALGYDVSLLLYGRSENEYPVSEGVRIHTVAATYDEYQKLGYLERLRRMRRMIKNISPDVVINFLPRMQIWMMMALVGIKTYRVETVRVSPWMVCRNSRAEKALWKHCFRRADAVILQTVEQGEFFGSGIQKKSIVIPNPISPQYLDQYKKEYSEKATRFVAVGRLTEQKNYPMMFSAFKLAHQKHPEIRLSVFGVGKDAYVANLKQCISELDMDGVITLEGRSNTIPEELCRRDAFLMTSDYEGMPNALAEAMASGLVCLSTNCRTGPKDLITDGENGFLVGVNDVQGAADAIVRIVEMDPTECRTIGQAAREKVLTLCSEENSRDSLVSLIENGSIGK